MRAVTWLLGGVLIAAAATGGAAAAQGAADGAPAPAGKPPSVVTFLPGARTFISLAGHPAPVRLAWPAAAGVARYRARWSQAGAVLDIELPGTATAFEREVSTPGQHQLSLIAIDAAGRESPPAEIGVVVVEVAAIAPGFDEPEPASPHAPVLRSTPAFAIGARFRSPGLTCRLGDAPAGAEAVAHEAGAMALRCDGGAGAGVHIEVPVVIAPVLVDGPKRQLVRGATTKVHLTVASVAQLGERLEVEADGEVSVAEIQRTAHGLEVAVTPREGATTAGLIVRSRGLQLGRVELAIAPPPPEPPPQPTLTGRWLWLELGYNVGLLAPGDPPAIGFESKRITPGPLAGGRVGVFPTHRVGIEADLAAAALAARPGRTAWLATVRGQLAIRAIDHGRFGLRLLGGAGLINARGEVHYGGALSFETHPNLWLRFQALDAITAGRNAGYSHCLELQLGIVTSLGRLDRGW